MIRLLKLLGGIVLIAAPVYLIAGVWGLEETVGETVRALPLPVGVFILGLYLVYKSVKK